MTAIPTQASAGERAEHHAQEAERLLKGRLGIITNYVTAQVACDACRVLRDEAERQPMT